MPKLIYLHFLIKSLRGKTFTAFDQRLAEAVCWLPNPPGFCRVVYGLQTPAILPEVFSTFIYDLLAKETHDDDV